MTLPPPLSLPPLLPSLPLSLVLGLLCSQAVIKLPKLSVLEASKSAAHGHLHVVETSTFLAKKRKKNGSIQGDCSCLLQFHFATYQIIENIFQLLN